MADPHVCERCGLAGPTCCQLEPGNEESCFPLSDVERDRILDALSEDSGAFAQQPNSDEFIANMHNLFPGEQELVDGLFPRTKEHLRLAVDAQGRCRLLGPGGCVLPREARPFYCRLFPFWQVGGALRLFGASFCLAQQEGRTRRRMMDLLGTSDKQVRELYGRLRLAWGLPPKRGMAMPSLSQNRKKK